MLLRASIARAGEEVSRCPEFAKAEVTIGRRPTNDIILPNDGVSGSHAKLLVTGRTLTLVDLGSTNGTFVGGERVEGPRPVGAHEEVLIGDYRLTFALVEPSSDEALVQGRSASRNTPAVPLAAAFGWGDDPALPPPPPLLDEPMDALTTMPPMGPAMGLATGPEPALRSGTTADLPASAATFMAAPDRGAAPPPRVSTPTPTPGPSLEPDFDFDPASPEPLLEQVFTAVWSRVVHDVLAASPGVDRHVHRLLERALTAAASRGSLPVDARERLARELLGTGMVATLLKGDPDEVLVLGTDGVRIARGGHVSTGPSPFSCAAGVIALGSRLCGVAIDLQHPVAQRAMGGYVVQVIHRSCAGGVPTLALRRAPARMPGSLEELEAAGAVAPPHAEVLRAAVRGGLRIVVCVGPGAEPRPVLAALLAAAPVSELQVVVTSAGGDARGLRAGTVLLTRERACPEVVEAALHLRPGRLALEEIPWGDAAALDVLTASSLRVVASLRAASPAAGLQRLAGMMDARGSAPASARAFVAASVDLWVTVGAGREGLPRITALTELRPQPSGEPEPHVLATFDPERGTWSAVQPSPCLDDLVHRGLLDAARVLPPPEVTEDDA